MSATNRGTQRKEYDFYETPEWCTRGLMNTLNVYRSSAECDLTVLEPCIGQGAIARIIEPYFDRLDWCEIQKGKDFLTYQPKNRYDFIITNPPYSIADQFVEYSLSMADCVVMLLRINFLGGQKRYKEFWSKQENKPTGLYVLADRPSFTENGKTDATEYAWYVWDKTGEQPTGFHWIKKGIHD